MGDGRTPNDSVGTRRIAFVTGASRGIGAAAAVALAARGYDCVLGARTLRPGETHDHSQRAGPPDRRRIPGSLEETAAAVRAQGREALPLRLDLLDPESLTRAVDETERRWGPVDVLLNSGIAQTPGAMDRVRDLTAENLERIYRGNVLSPLWLVQRVLPGMLARGEGAVVNMVSQSGFSDPPAPVGEGGWGFAYGSSKAALARLVGVLAVEYADRGVRFFNVEPGFVVTELVRATGLLDEFGSQWRGAPPEVPAAVIAWLIDEEDAVSWQGRTVHAQKLCAELALVEGWPPPRP